MSASEPNLFGRHIVAILHRAEHPGQAFASETTSVNQTPVMVDTKAPYELGISVADGEFLSELSVLDEMFLMDGIL